MEWVGVAVVVAVVLVFDVGVVAIDVVAGLMGIALT
jgi:hypothetical protein